MWISKKEYNRLKSFEPAEVKPCPFCGGTADVFKAMGTRVECTECGARIFDLDYEKALAKWNKRTGEIVQGNPAEEYSGYHVADKVYPGRVVFTKNFLDIGLVAESKRGKPIRIYARFSRDSTSNDICPEYGGVNTVRWYDSGIDMTLQEWKGLTTITKDAIGFHKYWKKRLN